MSWGLHFTAACGLAAFLAAPGSAAAATIAYDLTGDTVHPDVLPHYGFIDLNDSSTVSGRVPAHTISIGDTLHVEVTLSHPIAPTEVFLFLQKAPGLSFAFDASMSFFSGATQVSTPASWLTPSIGSGEAIGFGIGNHTFESDALTFDKFVADVVILGMSQPTLTLPETWASLEIYDPNLVATTPLPGALLLMSTALGGLGFVARRKRSSAA